MATLDTSLGDLHLANPLILASGVHDLTRASLQKIKNAGAMVTKSIGLSERKGYVNPTVVELEYGMLNAMGLPNPGIDEYLEEIAGLNDSLVLIGSIFGKDSREFSQVAQKLHGYVSALELNMSCPHVQNYGASVAPFITEITHAVTSCVDIPVFVKLGMENIVSNAHAALRGHADGIVAINTIPAMVIDIETHLPILGNKTGGYSGPAIKPIGVRCIYELARNCDVPLIGVGGIMTAEDVIQYLMAGASAVQMGTVLSTRGVDVFSQLCHRLGEWMDHHGYAKIGDLVGLSHNK
jgi:dihydroorotate dehydrogenase (NAD+) catalytic subunit